MSDAVCLGGFLVLSAVVMLVALIRKRILLRGLVFSAATGLAALLVVSLVSTPLHLGVTFNPLSGAVSALYGIPGVVGLLVLRLLL